jgi:hypothetical protein
MMEPSEWLEESTLQIPPTGMPTVSVFALARYGVIKIVCSCSEVVLQTMKNYKAYYSLS